jgi:hypothetical protein
LPRKKNNKDFIIAGYRRIAQDKKPSAIQLRALDRLAVICGLIKLREQDPVVKGTQQEIAEKIPPTAEPDISAFMDFHGGGSNAATDNQSPSGQPDLPSDGVSV